MKLGTGKGREGGGGPVKLGTGKREPIVYS